ncbi:hypothetical protein [uncultured Gammaproteobacteria bacterium]|nr:hypothetical protein [uncultured Gammaproteobacteria bacterium]CAC9557684.1 hypothetical protein [uncultured Gammaproteobacteria bacterium]CAC9574446.1 hypothetical protein [uncultured Gammaproteobacteria bacterium]CAC9589375.1 hypothetical protein [uncultured Gammaproteobacteria bacterium]
MEKSLKNFSECYQRHRKQNGIDLLQGETKLIGNEPFKIFDKNNNCVAKLNFKEVSKEIGLEIQDKLHYIHSARQDTKHHFGLFIEGKDYPICYAALSEDIREYQIYGLESINKINTTNTIVMTRAFGFSKLPKNTMSKFFQRIKKEISSNTNNLVIVTALNPLLGFKGSIFLGASYIPYMLSPLKYHYDQNGCYLTRRALKDRVVEQQIKTPPIVWLARGLKTFVQKGLESNNNMKLISKNDYDKK